MVLVSPPLSPSPLFSPPVAFGEILVVETRAAVARVAAAWLVLVLRWGLLMDEVRHQVPNCSAKAMRLPKSGMWLPPSSDLRALIAPPHIVFMPKTTHYS